MRLNTNFQILTKAEQMYKFYYTIGHGLTSYGRNAVMKTLWQEIYQDPKFRKWLMRINFTCILLLLVFMQVAFAVKAQKISMSKKDASLTEIFREIRKQTGYDFVLPKDLLKQSKPVSIQVKNIELEEVLKICFDAQPFTYEVNNKVIIVNEKEKLFIENIISKFQQIDVRGKVVDSLDNPLSGATVTIKGTNRVTRADVNGEFYIQNVDEKAILVISYVGYQSKEIIASQNVGTIKLELAIGDLKAVEINAGYYKVNDRERTGSISKISSETIEKQPVSNVLMGLQNRVSGLDITQQSGVPGAGFTVQIRGRNSIGSGTQPLYIVDGVQYPSAGINTANSNVILQSSNPLSLINPNDIESVEVLKDADATAIYGSRGANGVILITTKKGKLGELVVNANVSQGFSQVGKRLNLMNTEQYLSMRMEAFNNDKLNPSTTDYDVNGVWDKNKYTDWQETLIGGTANTTNSSLSISGGNNSSRYLVAGSYYTEGTVFPGSFGFKRAGVHTNLDFGASESRFKANFTATYSNSISNLLSTDLTNYITLAPNAPDPYDENGKLNWNYNGSPLIFNPMSFLLYSIDANTDNLITNAVLSYKVIDNLYIKTSIGYTTIKREELAKSPLEAQSPSFNPTSANRSSQFGNTSNNSWLLEPQLTYEKTLKNSRLQALIGLTLQKSSADYRNIKASNFSSDELLSNISSASIFSITQSDSYTYKYGALFARLNYNLRDKYIVNLTARRDASSRFGSGNQIASFGAIGGAWIFSQESFIKNHLSFLSFGKLRGSFGITGNDQISDYQYLQLYNSSNPYQGVSTLITSRISNPNYSWETNKKLETALQLGFLKDKITLQTAYFRNRSSNQLVGNPLPPSVGATIITANLPAVVQNTGWEFDTSFQIIDKGNWQWSANFNLTIPKNKLVEYPGLSSSGNATNYIIGEPLSIRRFLNTSVDPQTGLYVFDDVDKNGLQNDADRYLHKFINPTFYGGFANSITYKQLTLDFLFSFTKIDGFSYLNNLSYAPGFFFPNTPLNNQTTSVLSRWQKPGDITDLPKFSTTTASYLNYITGRTNGTQSIADDSFIRLKNVSLSYRLPKHLLSKIKVDNLELTLQGQNLFTITKYPGLDPENNQLISRLPPLRTFSLGLRVAL